MKRVAILGGGMGALATAFELSELNKTGKKYDITIYQQGWRLGGKGASSSNPAACNLDWGRLFDPQGREGPERFELQHYCATIHPSDRYVLAEVGTHRYRLASHQSGDSNLFLTGDWTLTALSVGCLEAATLAGIQAARAIDWLEAGDVR